MMTTATLTAEQLATWKEVKKLQGFVLASTSVDREVFFGEPVDDQVGYLNWLRSEARDIRREARYDR